MKKYKYINEKDGSTLEGVLIGNKVTIDGKIYTEYEMMKDRDLLGSLSFCFFIRIWLHLQVKPQVYGYF